ncbi:MAG TPA: pyrroline-5-carboxylate reductase [Acidimicrobiales bacterium]|nr:pyrroline-5-carboxylate reductase [Acidimicrobiales bacterium]
MQPKVLVVGGGSMGGALARGLLAAHWRPADIVIVEPSPDRRTALAALFPGVVVETEPRDADGAVLAVKPVDAEAACRSVAATRCRRVLSIMAGVTVTRLESWLAPSSAVLRAMPNTPATVGAGVSALAAGSTASGPDIAWAEEVLGAVGDVVRVPEESLDAVTGLSGSGPAYVFLVTEALVAAGQSAGLSPEVSRRLAVGTVAGAGRLLAESGEPPERLRAQVTSPGGTTEAGLRVLEERGLREALAAAVVAATERSRELGA